MIAYLGTPLVFTDRDWLPLTREAEDPGYYFGFQLATTYASTIEFNLTGLGQGRSVMARTGATADKRLPDAMIVATAESEGIGLVSGDHGVLTMALRLQLHERPGAPLLFRVFLGTPQQRAAAVMRAHQNIKSNAPKADPSSLCD